MPEYDVKWDSRREANEIEIDKETSRDTATDRKEKKIEEEKDRDRER